jgi:hypothetical protein
MDYPWPNLVDEWKLLASTSQSHSGNGRGASAMTNVVPAMNNGAATSRRVTMDGNTAVAHVAYRV